MKVMVGQKKQEYISERIYEIKDICDQHGVEYVSEDENDDIPTLVLKIKKARDFTKVYIKNGFRAENFTTNDFYKYRFISGYEAIWSQGEQIVECLIDCPPNFGFWERNLHRKIAGETIEGRRREFTTEISYDGNEYIEISPASDVFFSFYRNKSRHRTTRIKPTTIKIKNTTVKTHSDALKVVKGLMSTVCFQLDSVTGLPLQLLAEKKEPERLHRQEQDGDFSIPNFDYKYDVEALSLYWNARSLQGMPLGQYLAFYQTIEFYYTVYSYRDAQLRIKNLLKDPKFDVHKEKDLSKILNIVKFNNSSNSFGNELDQLKATLKHCIDAQEVEDFFESEGFHEDIFTNKNVKKLAKQSINYQFDDLDVLFSDIAKRVYEIRCRIVHTKGVQDNVETLHPLSDEVRFISADLKLIEFLAKRILIANSQPL